MNTPSFCKNFTIQSCLHVYICAYTCSSTTRELTIDLKINQKTASGVVAWAIVNFDIATLKVGRGHQK